MNAQLQKFARDTLKEGLSRLPESNQLLFKKMYSHTDLGRSINDIVDSMSEEYLDWAMVQVDNSLNKKPLAKPV